MTCDNCNAQIPIGAKYFVSKDSDFFCTESCAVESLNLEEMTNIDDDGELDE